MTEAVFGVLNFVKSIKSSLRVPRDKERISGIEVRFGTQVREP